MYFELGKVFSSNSIGKFCTLGNNLNARPKNLRNIMCVLRISICQGKNQILYPKVIVNSSNKNDKIMIFRGADSYTVMALQSV